jgi:hypothetical protein
MEKQGLFNGYMLKIFHADYGFLYKNDKQISEEIFRAGGMCSGFKGEYCSLIQYDIERHGFSYGDHVIVNREGKIALRGGSIGQHPYLLKGCIAIMNKNYYNLKTGKIIVEENCDHCKSETFLFVENKFNKNYEKGVYQIFWETGEFQIFK